MRGRRLALAALIGAAPTVCLAVLMLAGALSLSAGLATIAIVLMAALAIATAARGALARTLVRIAAGGEAPARSRVVTGDPFGEALLAGAIARSARERTRVDAASRQGRDGDPILVERLPDPLVLLDARRQVQWANRAARGAFGDEIAVALRHPTLRAAIDRAFAGGGPETADLVLPVPLAREAQATVIPLDPPAAADGRILLLLSDRTRERAVERMRADFVANASHELRTPLASLIGFIDTLRGPAADDPPAQARFLGIMAEQAARMNRLIDDLLSLSRIEVSEHRPPTGRVAPGPLIQRCLAGFEPRLGERRMRCALTLAEDLPEIAGDADQLSQVLQNLLENALKYGRDGGLVRVAASRAGSEWPARPGVVLSVADDGPGIAREHLPRLTERFYRVDKGRSRAVGGTGLGLAIVRHIVLRHRGEMRIESVEGAGATFAIWLPEGKEEVLF